MKEKICIDIGIGIIGKSVLVPEKDDFCQVLAKRPFHCHKGTFGYTAIIGGCREYAGAVKLSNLACAALKSGCGVTKLAVAESVAASVAPYLLESTLFPMPDDNGRMICDVEALANLTRGVIAVSCGMGWGNGKENENILRYLLYNYKGVLLIDADGLNALSRMDNVSFADSVCKKIILTPHPLEFARLSGYSMAQIADDPIGCAEKYREQAGDNVILLLKGTATVIADKDDIYIVDRGCAGMATAGSGDVLSGILTGIMGYAEPSALSVACGAYIAGLAGEIAEKDTGSISMTSSDTVRRIPDAVREMTEQ